MNEMMQLCDLPRPRPFCVAAKTIEISLELVVSWRFLIGRLFDPMGNILGAQQGSDKLERKISM